MKPARATTPQLVSLAWPIATGMVSQTLLGLVDTKLVGGLGVAALGGVSVGVMLLALNYSVNLGVMRAVKVRTAFAVGEGRARDGVRYATAAVLLGTAMGLVVWALGRDVSPALRWLGVDAALVPYTRDFFAAVTYGAPASCVAQALINWRQALGDTRSPMIVGVLGNIVNAFLSYSLIYGRFGMPRLGVVGTGCGTALTEWLIALAMGALLARDARAARGGISLRAALADVLHLGVPTGLHFGAETLALAAFTTILGSIGAVEMAAHQVSLATIRMSFLPGIAVGEASCILVGQALGRRCLADADRANRSALFVAAGFMGFCGVVFGLFGEAIARVFTDDVEVIHIARRLLLVAAFFQVLDACNVVLRGSLRGAADVRMTAVIGILTVWTCVPTAAFLLGRLAGMGALGGWLGYLAEATVATIFFGWRWARGAWRRPYEAAAEGSIHVRRRLRPPQDAPQPLELPLP